MKLHYPFRVAIDSSGTIDACVFYEVIDANSNTILSSRFHDVAEFIARTMNELPRREKDQSIVEVLA